MKHKEKLEMAVKPFSVKTTHNDDGINYYRANRIKFTQEEIENSTVEELKATFTEKNEYVAKTELELSILTSESYDNTVSALLASGAYHPLTRSNREDVLSIAYDIEFEKIERIKGIQEEIESIRR